MKMKRNGRQYDYDYKLLILKGDIHLKLKSLSKQEKIPMGKLIDKLIEEKKNECSCK